MAHHSTQAIAHHHSKPFGFIGPTTMASFCKEISDEIKRKVNTFERIVVKAILLEQDYGPEWMSGIHAKDQHFYINQEQLIKFWKRFGPYHQTIHKTQELLFKDWFHGTIDTQEANLRLSKCREGTFLIRYNEKLDGVFLASVRRASDVVHFNIYNTTDGIFVNGKNYMNVVDFVESNPEILSFPCHGSVFNEFKNLVPIKEEDFDYQQYLNISSLETEHWYINYTSFDAQLAQSTDKMMLDDQNS